MNIKNKTTAFVTRTGILLALALIFQIGLNGLGQPVVGPLVNLVLIVTAAIVGTLSGIIVGLFTPLIALLVGILKFPPVVPFIMIGNVLYVVLFNMIRDRNMKTGDYLGIAIAALGKFGFLALSVRYLLPLFVPKVPPALVVLLTLPQLYTALGGGIIALIVMRFLPKRVYLRDQNRNIDQ